MAHRKEALVLHVGLDLSRRRIDVCVLGDDRELVATTQAAPDADGLRVLAGRFDGEVRAVVESMTGARFVHDTLESYGWTVEVADAQRVKALAPLTAKTDRIDARVLAELSVRDLIPAIWLPPPQTRGMRELGRFRLHLVKHRTGLKNRIHSTLISHGLSVPVSDLFGVTGRRLLEDLELPQVWRRTVTATVEVIDHLDAQISRCETELRAAARDHPDVAVLQTAPGIGPVLGYTIATEIGDITRFPTPKQLVGYRAMPPGPPIRRHRPAWPVDQTRATLAALGTDRGSHPSLSPPALPGPSQPHRAPTRPTKRTQSRQG